MKERKKLTELLGKQYLFFDGGTGSVLQGNGLKPGELPETWNKKFPEKIISLNYNYYLAGSNIVNTNTFGAFATKFFNYDILIKAAIENAKEARRRIEEEPLSDERVASLREQNLLPQGKLPWEREHYIAFDIGSCGKLLKPMGDLDFEDCISLFRKSFDAALDCGVDLILIETMNDSYETKAAVLAAKEAREAKGLSAEDLPIFTTTVYDEKGKLLTGADPETMTAILEGLGVNALGLNCSLGPKQMAPIVPRFIAASSTPVMVKPNAGLPRTVDGKTVYDVTAEEFAQIMAGIAEAGACVLGGCCGTTPEYICRLVNAVQYKKFVPIAEKDESVIASYTHTVHFGKKHAPVLIGERINPTGKKKFKQALRDNDIPYIIQQGLEQEEKGVHVLDVNVGLPEIDEKQMMINVVKELQSVTALPLQIDTSSPEVMEAALRLYNGKALINSVNGKKEIMEAVFPLVKKYGGLVVSLTIDEGGIPETCEGRMKIVKKLYETAASYGIKPKDIIIDPLAMAVSSDDKAPTATLQTVRRVHDEYDGNTILGISNISFGLPERELVTAGFFTMAMQNGLSAAIMNPNSLEMQKAYSVFCLLTEHDAQCQNYIGFAQKYAAEREKLLQAASSSATGNGGANGNTSTNAAGGSGGINGANPADGSKPAAAPADGSLEYCIVHGLKEKAASATAELMKTVPSVEIINNYLIPGLDIVGKGFAAGKMYLPQLLMSAEAAKSAFAVIKDTLSKSGAAGKSRGTVIVATVKGDIHDIGKNIVKVLLENYDFTVIDLGKDVAPEAVCEACIKDHVEVVGLSALMTTTVPAMEETIKLLRKEAPWAKVCVGGAVMTQEYADMIGADFYGKDAMDTVRYAERVFG